MQGGRAGDGGDAPPVTAAGLYDPQPPSHGPGPRAADTPSRCVEVCTVFRMTSNPFAGAGVHPACCVLDVRAACCMQVANANADADTTTSRAPGMCVAHALEEKRLCQSAGACRPAGGPAGLTAAVVRVAVALTQVDDFFGSLGGLPWYQLRCLRFIAEAAARESAETGAPAGRDSNGCSDGHSTGSGSGRRKGHCGGRSSGHSNGRSSMHASVGGLGAQSVGISGTPAAVSPGSRGPTGHRMNGSSCDAGSDSSSVGGANGRSSSGGCSKGRALSSGGAAAEQLQGGQPQFHMPTGIDLQDAEAARRAAAHGLHALPYMAEIYPIGGAPPPGPPLPAVAPCATAPTIAEMHACPHDPSSVTVTLRHQLPITYEGTRIVHVLLLDQWGLHRGCDAAKF